MRLRKVLCAIILALFSLQTLNFSARADEGMWPFNNLPRAAIKKKYGFDITDAWLRKVQLASVRFNSGGSGSFVSADGLVMTNHHIASDVLQKISTPQKDYIKEGFYAATRDQEAKAPDLELNQLVGIDDVIALYQGGQYNLYTYKKYTDVRLVFAPEFEIAFLGGDPDNFEYPRYDLDLALFRVYENDRPIHSENFFKWSEQGSK